MPPAGTSWITTDKALPPAEVPADWWGRVQGDIRRLEYQVSWQDRTSLADAKAAYQAPNRAHNLRTYFTAEGVRAVPRTGDGAWRWGLKLTGYGRPGDWRQPRMAEAVTTGSRVEYRRGDLTEWYVNDPRGLEQGFTLRQSLQGRRDARPPANAAVHCEGIQDSRLRIELAITGDLKGTLQESREFVEFVTAGGVCVLKYGELEATDARGRRLPAELELADRRLTLVVNDAGAVYPLTIDPLVTSPSWTAECNQSSAGFGFSVATAGDVNGDGFSDVIVGAYLYDNGESNEGRAFVYHGSAAGLKTTPAWTGESNQPYAYYGSCVATAGDVNGDGYSDVIVGAPSYDLASTDEGRAYVYLGSASGLRAAASWTARGNRLQANYGVSVSTAGDVNGDGYSDVIVGADGWTNGEDKEGRVLVYLGSASGLAATACWVAEGGQAGAHLGNSVATAGDVNGDGYADVIVGARSYSNGQASEGRVMVYYGSALGPNATPNWTVEGNQVGGNFGVCVATAGDVNGDGYSDVIVGANLFDGSQTDEGEAFVYHGSASGLSTNPDWTGKNGQAGSGFGASVAMAGDVNGDGYADVVVGASLYDNGQINEGGISVYYGSASGLSPAPAWTAESDQVSANFGVCVATAGDVNGDGYSDLIVGANLYDNGEANEGRAFVYYGSGSGLTAAPGWAVESDRAAAYFGYSVALAGDVNGDGYSDVIVGAPGYDNGSTSGRAFVYHGSAVGLGVTADWSAEGSEVGSFFGSCVSTAGDVNGDGYSDVIVAASGGGGDQPHAGRVFVYHGSATGLSLASNWVAEGGSGEPSFGACVSSAGDVNGDGYGDIVVGMPSDAAQAVVGRVFVYHGSATGLGPVPSWTAEAAQVSTGFGASVSTAGDVNADGFSDLIIGEPYYSSAQAGVGRVAVYHGSASGLRSTPNWTMEGDPDNLAFGTCVSTAGDVNGDGCSDIIVGAYNAAGGTDTGRAYVYHGSYVGLRLAAAWTAEGDQAGAGFGATVATAGDVNGDGCSEVVVGAALYDNGQTNEGRVFVYHGSKAGLSETADWTAEGDSDGACLGRSVSAAGDVNGDGFGDVIIGAASYGHDQTNEGRVSVYCGGNGTGHTANARQRQADDSTPIAAMGKSALDTSFRLLAVGRTACGRGRMAMEWEVKPFRRPFDGTGTGVSSSYVDPGLATVSFDEVVSQPNVATLYRWRVRMKYDPARVPLMPHGRWFTLPDNAAQEADLRLVLPCVSSVPFDFDSDCDVDREDLAEFNFCNAGPTVAYPTGCAFLDFDADGDVDQDDFSVFQLCLSGSGRPADPNCRN